MARFCQCLACRGLHLEDWSCCRPARRLSGFIMHNRYPMQSWFFLQQRHLWTCRLWLHRTTILMKSFVLFSTKWTKFAIFSFMENRNLRFFHCWKIQIYDFFIFGKSKFTICGIFRKSQFWFLKNEIYHFDDEIFIFRAQICCFVTTKKFKVTKKFKISLSPKNPNFVPTKKSKFRCCPTIQISFLPQNQNFRSKGQPRGPKTC